MGSAPARAAGSPGAGSTHSAPRCSGANLENAHQQLEVERGSEEAVALTVEVLPLGRDELLGGGLAHRLGEALAGDGVLGGEDAVVDRLAARHLGDCLWGGAEAETLPSCFRCGGRISD